MLKTDANRTSSSADSGSLLWQRSCELSEEGSQVALTFEMRIFNTASLGDLKIRFQLSFPFPFFWPLLHFCHIDILWCPPILSIDMKSCHYFYFYHLSPEQSLFARNWVLRYVTSRTHRLFVSRCLYLSFMD
jgi:hypothetical protein